jgi:hypothetical protein
LTALGAHSGQVGFLEHYQNTSFDSERSVSYVTGCPIFVRDTWQYQKGERYVRDLNRIYALAEVLGKDKFMASFTTTVFPAATATGKVMQVSERTRQRRSIDQQSGRALVILGHAIEYLADEFVHEGGTFTANRGQVEAIQILMAVNRQIYLACPEAPTFGQWLSSTLGDRLKFVAKAQRAPSRLHHGGS